MSLAAILLPVFAQVALTFGLLLRLGGRRLVAVRANAVRKADVSLGERAWPAAAQQASNAFQSQFELPVLFFALVPLAIVARKADLAFVAMSWIFVVTRLAHAWVYATTNHVPHRLAAFAAGAAVLLVMWIVFATRILAAPLPA